jgi:hypothetical protein
LYSLALAFQGSKGLPVERVVPAGKSRDYGIKVFS